MVEVGEGRGYAYMAGGIINLGSISPVCLMVQISAVLVKESRAPPGP